MFKPHFRSEDYIPTQRLRLRRGPLLGQWEPAPFPPLRSNHQGGSTWKTKGKQWAVAAATTLGEELEREEGASRLRQHVGVHPFGQYSILQTRLVTRLQSMMSGLGAHVPCTIHDNVVVVMCVQTAPTADNVYMASDTHVSVHTQGHDFYRIENVHSWHSHGPLSSRRFGEDKELPATFVSRPNPRARERERASNVSIGPRSGLKILGFQPYAAWQGDQLRTLFL